MPYYRIPILETRVYYATVEIEADSLEEAVELAEERDFDERQMSVDYYDTDKTEVDYSELTVMKRRLETAERDY